MLHNENLKRADDLYEVRHDNNGNAIHTYIKDGEATIYPNLMNMIDHQFLGDVEKSERFYCLEKDLEFLYESDKYNYYELKSFYHSTTDYVCYNCGKEYLSAEQKRNSAYNISTLHQGICCVCLEEKGVTHKRNYNYLKKQNE